MSGCAKAAIIGVVVFVVLGVASAAALVFLGKKAVDTIGEALGGRACAFITDDQAVDQFGPDSYARDLGSLTESWVNQAQDSRIALNGGDACFVIMGQQGYAVVTLRSGSDSEKLYENTRAVAETNGYLSSAAVEVGDESFCTTPLATGVGGVFARKGDRVTYVSFFSGELNPEATTTSSNATPTTVDESFSCQQSAKLARVALN